VSATPTAEQLVHEEAVRAVAHQQTITAELHGRVNLLVATAAIAISLLGREVFAVRAAAGCAIVALVGFLLVSGSALVMIWPRHNAPELPVRVSVLTEHTHPHGPLDVHAVHRHLLRRLEIQQWLMARRNTVLSRIFRIGGLGLLLQLAGTVAARFLTI
jgi:hypothetical protein